MSTPIKLHYFDCAALGEPIRWLLHYSGINFIDERIGTSEAFLKVKSTYPYGKVPVLEIEGETIHQTRAILRYLARKSNLVGGDEWEELECDVMVDTIDDLRAPLVEYYYNRNLESKAIQKENNEAALIPVFTSKLEQHVSKNGGHFVNGKLTWADFYFAGLYDYINHMAGWNIFADKPSLQALHKKVERLKGVKQYMEKRGPFTFQF